MMRSAKSYRPTAVAGHSRTVAAIISAVIILAPAAARADITNLRAATTTNVLEVFNGQPGSLDDSSDSFPFNSPSLPIEVTAGLGDFVGEPGFLNGARGTSEIGNPADSPSANPQEFGLEADCYSLIPEISYEVTSAAVERREVEFSQAELGLLGEENTRLLSSTVFLNGAVLVWSEDASRDLSGLTADFQFRVVQDTHTSGEEVVFEAELKVAGQPDAEISLSQSTILDSLLGDPDLLAGLVDEDLSTIIEDLDSIGRVHILILPNQPIQYAYFATAGQSFELRAETQVQVANLPDGTGVAAVFGREFRSLVTAIEPSLKTASGEQVQQALNKAIADAEPSGDSATSTGLSRTSPVCGAMGMQMFALSLLGLATLRRRGR